MDTSKLDSYMLVSHLNPKSMLACSANPVDKPFIQMI